MHEAPSDLDPRALGALLRDRWGLAPTVLEHAPVGFGGYHWRASDAAGRRWFVTAWDLDAGPTDPSTLAAALATAATLAAQLDGVVGPLTDGEGRSTHRLGRRYAVAVFPWAAGASGEHGQPHSAEQRRALLGLLAAVHRAAPAVPEAPRRDPGLAGRPALERALDALDTPWTGGPYAEPTRRLLTDRQPAALRAALADYDALLARVRAEGVPWVLTHGEPHPGNVLWSEGRPALIDWDTVGLAPAGRDLWQVTEDPAELAAYAAAGGGPVSSAALRLYRLRWDLDEITLYVDQLRRPHGADRDTATAFEGLVESLDRALAAVG
ncbi:phosphotransferase [Streptomyces sp. 3MP-14]|uniref:Phosphotransferase n=1 Tax=Streptomyces mimosae TaxID=2586635 RepID=A0A5N6AEQ6_9ACTN|nr:MULTISPECIES: phosphotransferase [Streptomyces]KAB8166523.1 phosphotransferase [Streptomyces mimosae]KAB8178952.1 phosphotransferase [Streptomyces sp. 3MP-14]